MVVRSAMPWPFRWAIVAIVLGFCAAIGLWAFEFGKDIAGLEKGSKEELLYLRTALSEAKAELVKVKQERDHAQSIANTADTLVTAEKASHQSMLAQLKQLEADNCAMIWGFLRSSSLPPMEMALPSEAFRQTRRVPAS